MCEYCKSRFDEIRLPYMTDKEIEDFCARQLVIVKEQDKSDKLRGKPQDWGEIISDYSLYVSNFKKQRDEAKLRLDKK